MVFFTSARLTFKDAYEKARYMADRAEVDATDPAVLIWADHFNQIADDDERAVAIFEFAQYALDYVNDPRVEILDSAGAAVTRGFADCDAKVRVILALAKACRIRARIDPVIHSPQNFPHVRVWMFIRGKWRRCDPTIQNSAPGRIPRRGFVLNAWGL